MTVGKKKLLPLKLFFLGLFLLAPLFFFVVYHFAFPLILKKSIDNIYTLPLENEIFIYGEFLLNHGIIKVREGDNWEKLLAKVKSIKKQYTLRYSLKSNDHSEKIPRDFLSQEKVNLDDFFIKEKIKKYDGKQKSRSRQGSTRKPRYR